jgi:NADPH2:quinone reductase
LVHAAAGGVGLVALQMAKAIGAIVIATASSTEKLDVCKKYGADYTINYKTQNWVEEIKKITGKQGVDVVFDPVGLVDMSLKVVGWNSRILVIGFAAGTIEKVAMNKALLKSCSIVGVFWGGNVKNRPESVARIWNSILQMVARKELVPVLFEKVYNGIEQVPEALIALGNRETYGKVVIKIAAESSKL